MLKIIKGFVWSISITLPLFMMGCGEASLENLNKITGGSEAAPQNYKIKTLSTTSLAVERCSPIVLLLKDRLDVLQVAPTDIEFSLAGFSTSEVFSDSACTSAQSLSMAIPQSESSKVFYVKPSQSRDYLMQISGTQSLFEPLTEILAVTGPVNTTTELKLAVSGSDSLTTNQCRAYLLSLQSLTGVNRTLSSNLVVDLSGNGAGSFYAGTNCAGSAITNVELNSGTSFISFSFKSSSAENLIFIANPQSVPSSVSIHQGIFTAQVSAPIILTPTQLMLTGPSNVTAGVCSGPIVVKTLDATANPVAAATDISLVLTGGAGFSTFADSSCVTPLVAPKVAAGNSTMSYYFIASTPGSLNLVADDGGSLTDASLQVMAAASLGGTAVKLAVSGAGSVTVGQCSASYVVRTLDGSNIEYPVNATTTVQITGSGAGAFYADPSCSTATTSLVFAAGESSKAFYFKSNSVASHTFNVDDSGPLTPNSLSVAVSPGTPSQLALMGPSPSTVGDCRAYSVSSKDSMGFAAPVSSASAINLSTTGGGQFYSDSACTSQTTSVVINSGQSSAVAYFKSAASGSFVLTADNSSVWTSGTLNLTIDPLPQTKLTLTKPALSSAVCTAVSVTARDSLNNAVNVSSNLSLTVSSTGAGQFYSDMACSSASSSFVIPSGQSQVTAYFKDNTAESVTITASSAGLSSDVWSTSVSAGSPNKLAFLGLSAASVGECLSYDLRVLDAQNNLSAVNANTTVNFAGLGSAKVYSDAGCTTQVSGVVIPTSNSQKSVYLKSSVAESLTITASSTGLTSTTHSLALSPLGSHKIHLSGVSSAVAADCVTVSAAVKDSYGNPVNQASALTMTLLGDSNGIFYSDAACTSVASTAVIPMGSSQISYYFKTSVPESLHFVAQAAGLVDGEHNLAVQAQTPTKILLTGASMVNAGVCLPLTVSLLDALDNLSAVGSSKTIQFTGGGTGSYYSDSNCSVVASSIVMSANQTTGSIYFKANSAQNLTLNANDIGLPDLAASNLSLTVNSTGSGINQSLRISGSASINSNTCVPFAIGTVDANGNSMNTTSDTVVSLSGAGTGAFYSDTGCASASTSFTITNGSSLVYAYYLASTAQSLVLSATSVSANSATFPLSVVTASGNSVPTKILLAGKNSIATTSCIPYVITVADSNNSSVAVSSDTTINMSGAGSGGFFSNATCSTPATSLLVANGSSFGTLYYKNGSAQNVVFVAQATGLSNGTLPVEVTSSGGSNSGPAVKLAFVAQPSATATVNTNFSVQPIVTVQDSNNSVVSSSNATITLGAYSDAACTTVAGGTLNADTNPMSATGGMAEFSGVNETNAQTIYLKASSPGLASACSTAIQIYPSAPVKLAFSVQPSNSATAGATFATLPQVSVLNHTGQVMTSSTNPVSLAAYSDSLCTTPASGTFNVAANNLLPSNGVVAFSGVSYNLASTVYLKATSSGLESACSTGIQVSAAAAHSLTYFLVPPTSAVAGESFPVKVTVRDAFGNTAPVSDNITLTGYPSSNCTGTPITGFSGGTATAASLGTASFAAVSETIAGTLSIKATNTTNPGVLSVCSNQIDIQGATAATLTFSVQPSSAGFAYSNLLTSPVVRVTDSYGNIVANSNNAVTLSAFTNSSCTTAASGTLLAANNPVSPNSGHASFSAVSFDQSGTIYLKASSSGLTSACSNAVVLGSAVSAIAAGGDHTCALSNSNVYCWGYNNYGQLGNGNTVMSVNTPVQVQGVGGTGALSGIVAVTAGANHTCALAGSGSVYCWGYNTYGQLGDNSTTNRSSPVQVRAVGGGGSLTGIKQVSAGGQGSTCAVSNTGELYCWGYNNSGRLGDNTTTNRSSPVQVVGVSSGYLSNITQVSVGSSIGHSCAVDSSNNVYCWGYNSHGQLGNNTNTASNRPVQVVGSTGTGTLTGITQVSVGDYHSCARHNTGSIYCWGYNAYGQLGLNNTTQSNYPRQVLGVGAVGILANIVEVAAGGSGSYGHSCALETSGKVLCWGYNDFGQIGDNSTSQRNTPVYVVGESGAGHLTGIYKLALPNGGGSYRHSCALATSGEVYCFGSNYYGQLGKGSSLDSQTQLKPTKVWQPGTVPFTSIAASSTHACGVTGGMVYCWGYNGYGQLGDGTTNNRYVPTAVVGVGGTGYLTGINSVYVSGQGENGYGHTCAVSGAGIVYCWGYNGYGQIGDGSTTQRNSPMEISGVSGVLSMELSWRASCAVTGAGSAYCWGNNSQGQLGDNSTTQRPTPTQVVGPGGAGFLSGVTSISTQFGSSYGHTCAVAGGAAYCWGNNSHTAIGDGTSTQRLVPTPVSGLSSGVTAILAGESYNNGIGDYGGYSCALVSGNIRCWGYSHANNNLGATPGGVIVSNATTLTGGREGPCYITTSGLAACYGLGNGGINFAGLNNVVALSNNSYSYVNGNYETACAIVAGGSVYCVNGSNGPRQVSVIGHGTNTGSTAPWMISYPTPSGLSVTNVAVGGTHTCAVGNGNVNCWGAGTKGALGNGGTSQVNTTSNVLLGASNLSSIAAVTAGSTHGCALTSAGNVYCWGDNLYGDLGNNSTTQSNTAVQVRGPGGIGFLSGVTSLASGFRHNCSVSGGAVYCWGWDGHGQLGNNSTISAAVPTQVVGVGGTGYLSGFTKVTAGYAHSCGLKNDGTVFCWGNNQYGQLGNNSYSQSNTPVQVVSVSGAGALTNVTAIAAGGYHTCAISSGQVFCWGANESSQLGNASTVTASYPQGALTSGYVGLTGATNITAGANYTCITTSSGGVQCWGSGASGQLGSGGTSSQNVAQDVVGVGGTGILDSIANVAASSVGYHTCALNTDNSKVYCWGAGASGQMGNGATPSTQLNPVQSTVAIVGISYFIAR